MNRTTLAYKRTSVSRKKSYGVRLAENILSQWQLYVMFLPAAAFYILFGYRPMYGALIAFKNYSPQMGIMGSEWVGMKHFTDFIGNPYFIRTLLNTLRISISFLVFSFPIPIILALLINELRSKLYSRVVQTMSYIPHFISLVVVCGIIKDFTKQDGIITQLFTYFGFPNITMLNEPGLFTPIFVVSGIWQSMGWDSIVFLAALTSIDQELYEAARLDGAGRLRQIWHISIRGIMATIIILFVLRIGGIMNIGYEKIMLLYNPAIYSKADVINTYVFRRGIIESSYSFSAAVGIFNSVINCFLLLAANYFSKRITSISLW